MDAQEAQTEPPAVETPAESVQTTSDASEPTREGNAGSRRYTREELLHLASSPLVSAPAGLKNLRDCEYEAPANKNGNDSQPQQSGDRRERGGKDRTNAGRERTRDRDNGAAFVQGAMGDFRLQSGNLPAPRRTEPPAKDDVKDRRPAGETSRQPGRANEEGGWRTVTKPAAGPAASRTTGRERGERGDRDQPRDREPRGDRSGRERNGVERRGLGGERLAGDRGGERKRWNDDVPDISGRLPSSAAPAWMDSDTPSQLSSSLPDNAGHADPLQAFKAQMREMERRQQQTDEPPQPTVAQSAPPPSEPTFSDPTISSHGPPASSISYEPRAQSNEQSDARPRASRFAKFFAADGKPPPAPTAVDNPPAAVFSPPPSVPQPSASAPPTNAAPSNDMDSMRRVMNMLQLSRSPADAPSSQPRDMFGFDSQPSRSQGSAAPISNAQSLASLLSGPLPASNGPARMPPMHVFPGQQPPSSFGAPPPQQQRFAQPPGLLPGRLPAAMPPGLLGMHGGPPPPMGMFGHTQPPPMPHFQGPGFGQIHPQTSPPGMSSAQFGQQHSNPTAKLPAGFQGMSAADLQQISAGTASRRLPDQQQF